MRKPSLLALVAMAVFGSLHALAGNVRIIANPSVPAETISASELKSVFLEERNFLRNGTHVQPVLSTSGPAHTAFLQEYLGESDDTLQAYYRTLVFTGRGSMPKVLHSDEEVVAYVARTRGAIGYVSSNAVLNGVKILMVYQPEDEKERRLIFHVEPAYPDVLRNNGIGGTVRVQVTIASSGAVENLELIGGNPVLGE